MAIVVHIAPNSELYIKNPQSTDLGQRILYFSIQTLDELGLEGFTFKKLAGRAGCTEATVYRYFTSKHQLLKFLVAYYWDWVHHLINEAVNTESTPVSKLKAAVTALTHPMTPNPAISYIDERVLHRVVLTEGTKAYHSKQIDAENDKGIFRGYKSLVNDLAELMLTVKPDFQYPRALASSLFEMAHNHIYFAQHLPRLTDLKESENTREDLEEMLLHWVTKLLDQKLN